MTRRPTINELCRNRLSSCPEPHEASRDERVAVWVRNIGLMAEEMGFVPAWYPQSAEEVPGWIDQRDRNISALHRAIRAVAALPDDALIPAPIAAGGAA